MSSAINRYHFGKHSMSKQPMSHIIVECFRLSKDKRGSIQSGQSAKSLADWLGLQVAPVLARRQMAISITAYLAVSIPGNGAAY